MFKGKCPGLHCEGCNAGSGGIEWTVIIVAALAFSVLYAVYQVIAPDLLAILVSAVAVTAAGSGVLIVLIFRRIASIRRDAQASTAALRAANKGLAFPSVPVITTARETPALTRDNGHRALTNGTVLNGHVVLGGHVIREAAK